MILPRAAKKFRRCNLSTDHWKQILKIIPKYHKISNYRFKILLLEFISARDTNPVIIECLNNSSILQFFHKHTELMSAVTQLHIERQYWNSLSQMMTITKMYLLNSSKELTMKNSINWDHSRSEEYIEHRKNYIEHKLQEAEDNLDNHSQLTLPFYHQMENINGIDECMNILPTALNTLVEYNLQYLHTNFEQKKTLWQFNIDDMCLVKSFYDLNPTDEQVRNDLRDSFIDHYCLLLPGIYGSENLAGQCKEV